MSVSITRLKHYMFAISPRKYLEEKKKNNLFNSIIKMEILPARAIITSDLVVILLSSRNKSFNQSVGVLFWGYFLQQNTSVPLPVRFVLLV